MGNTCKQCQTLISFILKREIIATECHVLYRRAETTFHILVIRKDLKILI